MGKEEANVICKIPISKLGLKDKMICGFTKTVNFSVKSAYHLDISVKRRDKGEPSAFSNEGQVWKGIWKLNVPAVVKNFMWKAVSNCLPTK